MTTPPDRKRPWLKFVIIGVIVFLILAGGYGFVMSSPLSPRGRALTAAREYLDLIDQGRTYAAAHAPHALDWDSFLKSLPDDGGFARKLTNAGRVVMQLKQSDPDYIAFERHLGLSGDHNSLHFPPPPGAAALTAILRPTLEPLMEGALPAHIPFGYSRKGELADHEIAGWLEYMALSGMQHWAAALLLEGQLEEGGAVLFRALEIGFRLAPVNAFSAMVFSSGRVQNANLLLFALEAGLVEEPQAHQLAVAAWNSPPDTSLMAVGELASILRHLPPSAHELVDDGHFYGHGNEWHNLWADPLGDSRDLVTKIVEAMNPGTPAAKLFNGGRGLTTTELEALLFQNPGTSQSDDPTMPSMLAILVTRAAHELAVWELVGMGRARAAVGAVYSAGPATPSSGLWDLAWAAGGIRIANEVLTGPGSAAGQQVELVVQTIRSNPRSLLAAIVVSRVDEHESEILVPEGLAHLLGEPSSYPSNHFPPTMVTNWLGSGVDVTLTSVTVTSFRKDWLTDPSPTARPLAGLLAIRNLSIRLLPTPGSAPE